MKPKFDLEFSSNFYIKKLPTSLINEMKLDVKINYVIRPQLSLQIHRQIKFERKDFEFSIQKYEFETQVSIGNVAKIPGKISFYDFQVESLKIHSKSSLKSLRILNTLTKSCSLKGKIETGFMFLNEKIIQNFGEGVDKIIDSSCQMIIDYSSYSYVKIKFSFKVEFEWDKRRDITYSSVFTSSSYAPISQWLSSRQKKLHFIFVI